MPLDSDVSNADAHLHVEFYEHKREPHVGKTFCRIVVPGDKTFVHDQPVTDSDKARFPRHWLHYQMQTAPDAPPVYGTPLKQWHEEFPDQLSEVMLIELQILKFTSTEQVAAATDAQLQRIGMGAAGLRIRAQNYLNGKNRLDAGAASDASRQEIDALKAQVAALMAHVAKPQIAVKPRGKPGRKPGFQRKEATHVEHHAPVGDAGNG